MSRVLMSVLFCAGTVTAQNPPCLSQNGATNTVSGARTPDTGAPNSWAYRLSLPATMGVPQDIEIFTGNTAFAPGFMKLELWFDDPATNLPQARWAGGTWQIAPSLGDAWQGTNMDWHVVPPVTVWLVWTEPGLSTVPHEPGGVTLPAARLTAAGWVREPSPQPLKIRMRCNQWRTGPGVMVVGRSCSTFDGPWGTLFTNQPPMVGNAAFAVEGNGFPSGRLAILMLGTGFSGPPGPGGLPPNCTTHPATPFVLLGMTGVGTVRASAGSPGAAGHVSFPLPIPANPSLAGLVVSCLVGVHDPRFTTPNPFSTSNGLALNLF